MRGETSSGHFAQISGPFDKRRRAAYFVVGGTQVDMDNPLNIDFDRTYRLAIFRPVGLFGAEHLGQVLNFLIPLETSNQEPFNRLLDLTLVTEIRISGPAIYEFARARREATAHLPPFRTAIIATDPSAEEVALLYATLMQGSKIQVGIFRDTSSAADWVCVPESVIQSDMAKQKLRIHTQSHRRSLQGR
jgi:hypothetical protein